MRIGLLVAITAAALLVPAPAGATNVPVPPDLARQALHWALERQGDPYVWGGQSPGSFDCSGLILWAYEQALGDLRLPDGQGGYVADATMDHLWRHASRRVRLDQVRPGDVVFITSEGGRITHGGLVIAVSETEVTFVNASSSPSHRQVVVDTWPLNGKTREQWVVGFGQLLILPGRRPPMPPAGAGTRRVHLEPSLWPSAAAPHLIAAVAADGLQSEAVLVQPFGLLAVGVGVRVWNSGWRGDQYLAGGTEPFALASATLPVGPLRVRGTATHAESGCSSLWEASWEKSIRGATMAVTAGFRRWAPDPWYSGPLFSLRLTF